MERITKQLSNLEHYLALNREYTVAEYLTTVTDTKLRKSLTDSVSIAFLLKKAAEGRHGSEETTHCPQNEVETVQYFLTSCQMYDHIRDTYFPPITQTHKEFENISNFDQLSYLLGEIPHCAIKAAIFVTCCHKKMATCEEETPL